MTQLTELLPGVYASYIPKTTEEVKRCDDGSIVYSVAKTWRTLPLPPGNWSIICCSKTATEADAAKVVEPLEFFNYKNYADDWECKTATESLASLIRSRGLDPAKNWLFLKLEQ